MASDSADLVRLFISIGLSEQKAKETLKNEALSSALKEAVIQRVHVEEEAKMASDSADLVRLFISIGLSEQKAKETLKNEALCSALKEAVIQRSRLFENESSPARRDREARSVQRVHVEEEAKMASDSADLVRLFISIGLSEQKAKETLKNEALSSALKEAVIQAQGVMGAGVDKGTGTLLYNLASKLKEQKRLGFLAGYIAHKKISTDLQLNAALDYVKSHPVDPISVEEFEWQCGVGVVVSPEQIEDTVEAIISKHKELLMKERYRFNMGLLMGDVKLEGKSLMQQLRGEAMKFHKTGENYKTEGYVVTPNTMRLLREHLELTGGQVQSPTFYLCGCGGDVKLEGKSLMQQLRGEAMKFHKTGENYKTEGYVVTPNTMRLLREHLELTGGQVRTRFPPEPNGILHIGHAKAINFNFGYAKDPSGKVVELQVSCARADAREKPKAFIQWVSNPLRCEVRLYERLFLHKNPEDPSEVPGGFLSDISPFKMITRLVPVGYACNIAVKADLTQTALNYYNSAGFLLRL
ncbi:UNVERIFIED_CONTAM: hypothetical protein FKN15_017883 [Acipenser sinensis]